MSDGTVLVVHSSAPIRTRLMATLRRMGAPVAQAVNATDALHYLSREPVPSSFVVSSKLNRESGIGLVKGLARLKRTQGAPVVLMLENAEAMASLEDVPLPHNVVPVPRFANLELLMPAIASAYERATPADEASEGVDQIGDEDTFAEMDTALECFASVIGMVASNKLPGPIMPKTLAEVRRIKSDPNTDFRAVSKLVATQPALAARVLKMANSAFYNCSVSASTIPQALGRLGLSRALDLLQTLALREFVVGKNAGLRTFIEDNLRQAYLVALVGSKLAEVADVADKNDVYTLGLFHNIGPTFFGYTLALLASKKKVAAPDINALRTIATRKCAELGRTVGEAMNLPMEVGEIFAVEGAESPNPAVRLTHQAIWISAAILGSSADELEADADSTVLGLGETELREVNQILPELRSSLSSFEQ